MIGRALKQIKVFFNTFPKKHLILLIGGSIFLLLLTIFSNIELALEDPKDALLSKISLDNLDSKMSTNISEETSVMKRVEVKRNDSLFSILKRLEVDDKNIINLVKSDKGNLLAQIKIGKILEVEISNLNKVISLNYIIDFKSGVRAERSSEEFIVKKYELNTEKSEVFRNVVIKNSLYADGLKQNIPDSVIMDLVYIFGWDIDFVHDIRPGDSYSLIYEEIFVDGEKKLNGDILIAEFINRGKVHKAIRYKSEYFSSEGRNIKKAFLRSPVKFSYISSRYNLKRRHPILHKIRAHTGVDYAATRGTPVRATGDGTIIFADKKGGYGNLVEIKHTEDYSTRYAHLDKFHQRIKVGKKVKQSETIGYVGRTGTATGDHLHYEFRVNGKHTNPLTVKLPNATPIQGKEKKSFEIYSKEIISKLKNYQKLTF